jgi:Mg2+ and Co2+ transporter CorA
VQDVEALLEAYSLQADFFLVQLENLSSLVDQFQADANYELDRRRNQLFAIQLIITIVTMAFSAVSCISGIFGMNLKSSVFDKQGWFLPTVFSASGLAFGTSALLLGYLRKRSMLFLGS